MKFAAIFAITTFTAVNSEAALVAYWNFNGLSNPGTPSNANVTTYTPTTGSASLNLVGWNSRGGATSPHGISNFAGSAGNAIVPDPAGQALALQGGTTALNNNGASLVLQFDMTLMENPVITFDGQRSGTGFNSDQVAWSTDGSTWANFGTPINLPAVFAVQTIDLSSVSDLDNTATAFVRITFSGATNASGNNRIDNIQINATPIPEPSTSLLGLGALALTVRRRR